MGTWEVGSFDNDTAADWAFELEEAQDLELVDRTLSAALGTGLETSLSAEAAECAVAAADVVARLLGRFDVENAYTEPVDAWVRSRSLRPDAALVEKARAVVERVRHPPSELRDLWEESGGLEEWMIALDALKARLA